MGYAEDTFAARTKLADFFSILLGNPRSPVEKTHGKTASSHARHKHCTDYHPTGRKALSSRFSTPKLPTQIGHVRFRPEPFIL